MRAVNVTGLVAEGEALRASLLPEIVARFEREANSTATAEDKAAINALFNAALDGLLNLTGATDVWDMIDGDENAIGASRHLGGCAGGCLYWALAALAREGQGKDIDRQTVVLWMLGGTRAAYRVGIQMTDEEARRRVSPSPALRR